MCVYFRSALRFVCGIFVFGVTWILLGKSSESSISFTTWKQFMVGVFDVLSLPKLRYVTQKYLVDNFEVVAPHRFCSATSNLIRCQEGQGNSQNLTCQLKDNAILTDIVEICQ